MNQTLSDQRQEQRERFIERATHYGIPGHMVNAITNYVCDHRPVGGFLTAVLSNDLKGAVEQADHINQLLIPQYVKLLYNHAPMTCWGSPENHAAWLEQKEETS